MHLLTYFDLNRKFVTKYTGCGTCYFNLESFNSEYELMLPLHWLLKYNFNEAFQGYN